MSPISKELYCAGTYYNNGALTYIYEDAHELRGSKYCFPVEVDDVQNKQGLIIYPNPVITNEVSIVSPAISRLSVTDITGKILTIVTKLPEGKNILQTPAQPGIYFLKAELADGSVQTRKIIKQ
jgi:hypothetical protein